MPNARQKKGETVVELYADEKRALEKSAGVLEFFGRNAQAADDRKNADLGAQFIRKVLASIKQQMELPKT
jgi:hypothetical protein